MIPTSHVDTLQLSHLFGGLLVSRVWRYGLQFKTRYVQRLTSVRAEWPAYCHWKKTCIKSLKKVRWWIIIRKMLHKPLDNTRLVSEIMKKVHILLNNSGTLDISVYAHNVHTHECSRGLSIVWNALDIFFCCCSFFLFDFMQFIQ